MKKIMHLFIAIVVVAFSAPYNAQDSDSAKLAQSLVEKSGIKSQLEQIPQLLQAGLTQSQQRSKKPLSTDVYDNLNNAIQVSFDPETLQKFIQDGFAQKLSNEEITFILNWLNSPLGDKIIKMEESASTAEAYNEMLSMKDQLIKDTERVNQIQKLDEAIRGSQSNLELGLNVQYAMAVAMASALEPDNPELLDNIMKKVEASRSKIEASIKENTQVSFLYMYRNLDATELDQYISFAKTDSGKKYYAVILESMSKGILDASRNVGKIFGESLKKNKNNANSNGDEGAGDVKAN